MNHYVPCRKKIWKNYFYHEGQSQGHKVIDLGAFLKGNHYLSMHTKYEASIFYGLKVKANVNVNNWHTGQKQYAPDHSICRHKKSTIHYETTKGGMISFLRGHMY